MAGLGETPASTEIFTDDLFEGEVALITGDGTGIGEQIALAFADHGADVAIASCDMDHLDPVAEKIEEKGQNARATTVDELGSIDILVNNAGANFVTPTEELRTEIKQFVRDRLAAHEYPREIEFTDELPKTVTGKIRRTQLREAGEGS